MPAAAAEDENLWANILDEVQSRSSSNLPQSSLLVLGDNESGKTALIAHLRKHEDAKRGAGLEYHFLDVNPDYKDGSYAYQLGSALPDVGPGESARIGVWILDGDPVHAGLIRFGLQSAAGLDRCLVLLCASMTQPWSIMESLQRWSRIVEDHLSRPEYRTQELNEAREKQIRFWQEYVEPLDSSSHSDTGAKVPSMETDGADILLPLGQNTLTNNIGLPFVVVITKTDYMSTLEKDYDFKDEHFDFMQLHIRKFCLTYGAAVVYTSVKDARNCDLLYKYLLHRSFGFSFTQPALVVEKDSIFIPAGWDNEKKISILTENLMTFKPDDLYTDVIQKPVLRRPVARDQEIAAEDEQGFLARQQTLLNTQAPATPSAPHRQDAVGGTATRSPNITPKHSAKMPQMGVIIPATAPVSKKPDNKLTPGAPGAPPPGEGVLANFFNQLLSKNAAGTPTRSPSQQKSLDKSASHPATNDVASTEVLQRIMKQANNNGGEEGQGVDKVAELNQVNQSGGGGDLNDISENSPDQSTPSLPPSTPVSVEATPNGQSP